jgi:SAM-dependent methyltransferase
MLPQGGSILEFGEANWYNDVSISVLLKDIDAFISDEGRKLDLTDRLRSISSASPVDLFEAARLFYDVIFQPSERKAIDLNGTPDALPLDLNEIVDLGRQFDICINNGTAEHVFDIGNFFRNIHQLTAPGGLMFHEAPMTGWLDHGFYNFQPTFFFDLAHANDYEMLGLFVCDLSEVKAQKLASRKAAHQMARRFELPENANLFAALRKPMENRPFKSPQQGFYDERLDQEEVEAWRTLR